MDLKTVMVIEDDDGIGEFLTQAIVHETPYQAIHIKDVIQAWNVMQSVKPDLLVLDYRLPLITGLDFYDRLQAGTMFRDVPALFISAYPSQCQKEAEARHLLFLKKPFELDDFVKSITSILQKEPM